MNGDIGSVVDLNSLIPHIAAVRPGGSPSGPPGLVLCQLDRGTRIDSRLEHGFAGRTEQYSSLGNALQAARNAVFEVSRTSIVMIVFSLAELVPPTGKDLFGLALLAFRQLSVSALTPSVLLIPTAVRFVP